MFKKIFPILFIFLLLLAAGIFYWNENLKPVDSSSTITISFDVKKGTSLKEIASNLKNKKLIRNSLVFTLWVKKMGFQNSIQAGHFRLSQSFSTDKIIKELTHGTADIWLTIPEGLRKEEIAEKIYAALGISQNEFLDLVREGYIYPDTYLIPKDASAKLVVQMISDNFKKRLKSVDSDIFLQEKKFSNLTLDEMIILASIIEREAKYDDDRYLVSGILHKRLASEWALEVDATLQYALGYQKQEKTWWKKELTADDLKLNSQFNTRKYKGLPPSPICNFGLSSLKAAMMPKENPYWFYISDKTGKMHYARTLEEHTDNINKYL